MGIPIGWNIKRDEPKEKDVLRADVTGQRSPIRRRARPNRSPTVTSQAAFDTDFLVSDYTSRHAPQLEPASRPSHTRTRLAPPPVPEVSRNEHRSHANARNPPTLQREEGNLRRSRNRADNYARVLGMRDAEMHTALDRERPLPALTPGFAPASSSQNAETQEQRDFVEFVRGQAAQIVDNVRRHGAPRRSLRLDQAVERGETAGAPEDEHESSDSNAVSFPPLRRMGGRTIADGPLPSSSLRETWSPASPLDGLGDRERSVSPLDEQSPWDNFLSTVVPDPLAPTAESSFASAAASASFSNSHPSSRAGSSNSAASSRTHLTVPSRRPSPPQNEQFMRACDTSDDETASDTEEEEVYVRSTSRRVDAYNPHPGPTSSRRRIRPSYFSNEPPMRDSERYSRRVLERSRDASAYVQSFYNHAVRDGESHMERPRADQLDGPVDEVAGAGAGDDVTAPLLPLGTLLLDQELRDARSLLERLSRREDISDDFWASVGLTRSFADPVERFQERERS